MIFLNYYSCLLLIGALFFTSMVHAETNLGIVTGGETGTYIKIGKDIKSLLREKNINVDVHTSAGSLENVYSIWKLKKAQMGIVQSDVLAYITTRKDSDFKEIAKKLRLVHPLYNEEVHILAANDVLSLEDLDGKSVAIGSKGSGTFLTADTLLKIADININPVYISGKDALSALKNGEVQAMFYVAGFPVKLLKEEVTEDDKLHLVPILDKAISEVYNVSSVIPADTYSFQSEDIYTVAVKATLITYAYKRANCGRVGNVANIIEDEIDWLRENGHPKWKSVDLNFKLNGWTQYECVGVKKSSIKTRKKTDGLDDFLRAISEQ